MIRNIENVNVTITIHYVLSMLYHNALLGPLIFREYGIADGITESDI